MSSKPASCHVPETHPPPNEKARVSRPSGELNRRLTPEELAITAILADESDPARTKALKKQIIAGFYGDEPAA
jgi:hypothetical protein